MKLGTITDALTVSQGAVDQVGQEVTTLVPISSFDLSSLAGRSDNALMVGRTGLPVLPLLESASATSKVSWLGLFSDVLHLSNKGQLETLFRFLAMTGQKTFGMLLQHIHSSLIECKGMLPITGDAFLTLFGDQPVGRLSIKEEAAGKVRVFAMVTLWDQAILEPLHKMLFAFLRRLPNDGTFNQGESVKRCLAKSTLAGCSFGYDLSAATDRLPLSIQKSILSTLLPGLGDIWGSLLTDRAYVFPETKGYESHAGEYRYAVGQPMGALSS